MCSDFLYLSEWVPRHGDGADGPEGEEGLLDGLLPRVVVDAADIDPVNKRLLSMVGTIPITLKNI